MDIFLQCKSGLRYILQVDRYLLNIENLEQKSVSWIVRPNGNRISRQISVKLFCSFHSTILAKITFSFSFFHSYDIIFAYTSF